MKPASSVREQYHAHGEDIYHTVDEDETFSVDLANRPPVPVPRPEASAPGPHPLPDNKPYISKGKCVWRPKTVSLFPPCLKVRGFEVV